MASEDFQDSNGGLWQTSRPRHQIYQTDKEFSSANPEACNATMTNPTQWDTDLPMTCQECEEVADYLASSWPLGEEYAGNFQQDTGFSAEDVDLSQLMDDFTPTDINNDFNTYSSNNVVSVDAVTQATQFQHQLQPFRVGSGDETQEMEDSLTSPQNITRDSCPSRYLIVVSTMCPEGPENTSKFVDALNRLGVRHTLIGNGEKNVSLSGISSATLSMLSDVDVEEGPLNVTLVLLGDGSRPWKGMKRDGAAFLKLRAYYKATTQLRPERVSLSKILQAAISGVHHSRKCEERNFIFDTIIAARDTGVNALRCLKELPSSSRMISSVDAAKLAQALSVASERGLTGLTNSVQRHIDTLFEWYLAFGDCHDPPVGSTSTGAGSGPEDKLELGELLAGRMGIGFSSPEQAFMLQRVTELDLHPACLSTVSDILQNASETSELGEWTSFGYLACAYSAPVPNAQ